MCFFERAQTRVRARTRGRCEAFRGRNRVSGLSQFSLTSRCAATSAKSASYLQRFPRDSVPPPLPLSPSSVNKSRRNDRRDRAPARREISNAILQFAEYLICRNSYNSWTANILFDQDYQSTHTRGGRLGGRAGGRERGRRDKLGAPARCSLRCTGDVRGFAVSKLQYR